MLPGEHLLWSRLLSIRYVWRDMTAAWDCQLLVQAVWLNLVFLSDPQGMRTITIVYLRRRPVVVSWSTPISCPWLLWKQYQAKRTWTVFGFTFETYM